jgi:general secretion pathway protein A
VEVKVYNAFYGLSENPFALTPDPRYAFLSEAHAQALALVTYGIQERKGFVVILGEVGTGKTTLIRHLLDRFDASIRPVFIFNPAITFLELLQLTFRDLELPCPNLRRLEMIEALNEYLLKEAAASHHVVLIIDEAQHLSPEVLEELRMLSNLETTEGKLIQILLVGQPEMGSLLARPELRQLRQRIGLIAELKPLCYDDTVRYVAHRLAQAGHSGPRIFTRRALRTIHAATGGIPRLVNVICDKALLHGYDVRAPKITRRLVKTALADWVIARRPARARERQSRHAKTSGPWRLRRQLWTVAAVVALGLIATASYLFVTGARGRPMLHWFTHVPRTTDAGGVSGGATAPNVSTVQMDGRAQTSRPLIDTGGKEPVRQP